MWQSHISQQASPNSCGTLNGLLPWPAHTTSLFIRHLERISPVPHLHLLHSCPLLYTTAYCQHSVPGLCFKTCFKTSFRDLPQDLVQVFCSETSLLEDLPLLQELYPLNYCNRPGAEIKTARPFTTQIISGTTIHYRDNCHRPVLQQNTKSSETKTRFQAGQK
ncbi:hypothetical protein B0H11DRAFT_2060121 [Mycena galericulata]|nr:hypothetical protein B0H11DRAFT_2060121 [Mycena galericulata]